VLPSSSVLSRSTISTGKGSSTSSGACGGSTVSVLLLLFKKPDLRESHKPAFKDQADVDRVFAATRLRRNLGAETVLCASKRHAVGMRTPHMEEEGAAAKAGGIFSACSRDREARVSPGTGAAERG